MFSEKLQCIASNKTTLQTKIKIKNKPSDKSDFAVIKNINMIQIVNEIAEKMKNFTKELEYINKTQLEIPKLNNTITEVRNSRGY